MSIGKRRVTCHVRAGCTFAAVCGLHSAEKKYESRIQPVLRDSDYYREVPMMRAPLYVRMLCSSIGCYFGSVPSARL